MLKLAEYFNCGTVTLANSTGEHSRIIVTKHSDIKNIIIPFFIENKLHGDKLFNFEQFCKGAALVESGSHLTVKGSEQLDLLRSNMNLQRE